MVINIAKYEIIIAAVSDSTIVDVVFGKGVFLLLGVPFVSPES